jgi:hypothetical protein
MTLETSQWSLLQNGDIPHKRKIVSGNLPEARPKCSMPRGKILSSAVDPMD